MFRLRPGTLTLEDMRLLTRGDVQLELSGESWTGIDAAADIVAQAARGEGAVYDVNTGFVRLAKTRIPPADIVELQHRLLRSHAVGTGDPLPDPIVRLILLLKINALARGYSGVRREVITALIHLFNANVLPIIPAKGSVGASGDLAPLAHLSLVLIGEGETRVNGEVRSGAEALKITGHAPLTLAAKEGLALLNGTQVSAALGIAGLDATMRVFRAGLIAGAMSVDAAMASDTPFDARLHNVRGHKGQLDVAAELTRLLHGSAIRASHRSGDERVQDPYSLRCQPQVMGAALDLIRFSRRVPGPRPGDGVRHRSRASSDRG